MGYFKGIVGQSKLKRQLSFYIDGYRHGIFVPNLLFIAQKGQGKTSVAKQFAQHLNEIQPNKRYLEINCASIGNFKSLHKNYLSQNLKIGKHITFLFDEASEIPLNSAMGLLSVLNPTKTGINIFDYGEERIEVNFRHHTFLFATTEPQKIFHALKDRLKPLHFEDYTIDQLLIILQDLLKDTIIHEDVLKDIKNYIKGVPREIVYISKEINRYLELYKYKTFQIEDWNKLKDILSLRKFGLTQTEYNILKIIYDREEIRLTDLAACSGLTRTCLQNDVESYLVKKDLISITKTGRILTEKGKKYIEDYGNS